MGRGREKGQGKGGEWRIDRGKWRKKGQNVVERVGGRDAMRKGECVWGERL